MGLNKKQKKQIESVRKKLASLQHQLAGAKKQPDDPGELPRIEAENKKLETQIQSIQSG